MTDSHEQAAEIRQFLLGRLSEERAERLEERIFADPAFAEEVEVAEGELIADHHAGTLDAEDRAAFERAYLKTAANLREVEFERVFGEFVRAKRYAPAAALTADTASSESTAAATSSETIAAAASSETTPATVAGPRATAERESFLSALRAFFRGRRALVGSALAACLLLVAGVWLLSPPRPGDSAHVERGEAEAELARLNAAEAQHGRPLVAVELRPAQRSGGGALPRIVPDRLEQNALLQLRLPLTQKSPAAYRAVFLDDRRRELFAVSGLTPRDTPAGPQVWLLVPARYFKRGDYQIDLRVAGDGGYEVNSYGLRVLEDR